MKPEGKNFLSILAAIVFALCSLCNCAKADTMNTEQKNTQLARQEKIVMIAAFTANGDLSRLKPALHEGLDSGLNVSEIREILIQLYAYTGFPRSLNGIQTFMDVVAEQKNRGIHDPEGEMPAALPPGTDRDAYGEQVRMKLAGITTLPPKAGYQLFAPGIDTFLKEHLFADIFGRGVLDYTSREIATVSALAAMHGTGAQLQFHMQAAMNVGVTPEQMENILSVLKKRVGDKEAENAACIYRKVLEKRSLTK